MIIKPLLPLKITFKGRSFDNTILGETCFFKGGVARDAAIAALEGKRKIEIFPRDLDLLVGRPSEELEELLVWSRADTRDLWDWVPEGLAPSQERLGAALLGSVSSDINLNECLLGKDYIWVSSNFLDGWKRKVITPSWDSRGKELIRAHFFAFRYGYTAKCSLPQNNAYYSVVERKAEELNLSADWAAYLAPVPRLQEEEEEEIVVEVLLEDGTTMIIE